MFSTKEHHLASRGKEDRPNVKLFDPWEHKLAFDHTLNDRMGPVLSGDDSERASRNDR